jgi:hypothetical protein
MLLYILCEDIFGKVEEVKVDSILANLAASFVSSMVNCGFESDTLLVKEGVIFVEHRENMFVLDTNWVYRNKDAGIVCAVASLGYLYLWDWETGFLVWMNVPIYIYYYLNLYLLL